MDRRFMILVLRLLSVILWRMVYASNIGKCTEELHKELIQDAGNFLYELKGGQ